ncbi:MAG TPA: hypothetical protein VEG42_05985 [Thermoplasmata archaeon]|jgi:hypothetical protein|nr:hypothetical protein [Thermoplasmata archaeon]HYB78820.1 hypothetical protein [Thermoplasmata archaeon]
MRRVLWVSGTVALVIVAGLIGYFAGDWLGYSAGHSAGYNDGYNQGYGAGVSDTLLPIDSSFEISPGGTVTFPLNLGPGTFNVTLSYGFQMIWHPGPSGPNYSLDLNFTLPPCLGYSTGWVNASVAHQGHPTLQCSFTDLAWSVQLWSSPSNPEPVIVLTTTPWSISYHSMG